MEKKYFDQVDLLVKCLPIIATEKCFAIKGGTAINLFYLNMPRLSVDLDLVYLPIENRDDTYKNIRSALERVANKLKNMGYIVKSNQKSEEKLICSNGIANIKIEPNYTLRGFVYGPKNMPLCVKAQNIFGYTEANIISESELWGGKICAALDRQHPRDLFDIKNLFATTGITEDIKQGFISLLLGGNRPLHEMLNPNFQMQEETIKTEFDGMSEQTFTFEDAREIFHKLVKEINSVLVNEDKKLLLDFVQLKADLSRYSIPNLDKLPGIQWKIKNLEKLRNTNKEKFQEQYEKLKAIL